MKISERDADDECEPIRIAPDPGFLSVEDMGRHRAEGHVPFRSWCEWCVAGRGVGEHHKRGLQNEIPVIAFDYLLVAKKGFYLPGTVDEATVAMKIW